MVTPKELLATLESTLLSPSEPSAAQRVELLHAVRSFLPSFRSLLSYPPPKPSDRVKYNQSQLDFHILRLSLSMIRMYRLRHIAMVEMCRVVGSRDQLISLLLLLTCAKHHPHPSSGGEFTYGEKHDSRQVIESLCGKLIPTLERLEVLSEEKVGHNLKVFHRLTTYSKEIAVQKIVL